MLINREKTALVYKGINYSYTDLLQYSLRYSEKFVIDGKVPERILIFSENTPEYIFAIYACLRLNAIVVPVDVMSTVKELRYIVDDCRPDLILVSPEKIDFVKESIADIENYTVPILMPEDLDIKGVETMPLIEIAIGDMQQVVSIIYTSGTTGSPKGVMLTYENYWYNVDAVINHVPIFNEDSRVILILPLHHVFPFAGALLAPIYSGGTIYIVDSLAPEAIIKTLQEGKITIMIGVPRLYDALAKGIMTKINASLVAKTLFKLAGFIGSESFSKTIFKAVHQKFGGYMEFFVSGGAALSIETGNIFKTLGFYVLEGFGMTECAPMIAFTRPGDRKVGYCGKLLPGLEMQFSESGEILVKGPNVMKGYYNRPEETAQIIRGGWLYTGDVGELDEGGRLRITGRIKEIIVTSNGKNINPVEIEHAVLADSKSINDIAVFLHDDVLQAIVVPDMDAIRINTGKTIEECIRPEIEAYNSSAMSYKRIKNFHVTSHELPKTRLGKIQRFKLDAFISEKEEKRVEENVSGKSEEYLRLKHFVDNETGMYANGDDHFEMDLSLDSLGRVSLLAYIEENFNVNIQEEQMNVLSTLNKLSAYVEENASIQVENSVSWKKIFEDAKIDMKLPKSGVIHWFMFNYIKLLFHISYLFKKKGRENVPKGPCIFVANHRSGLDPVFITSAFKWNVVRNTFFFAKEKHFQSVFTKFMAKRNNIISMDINSNVRTSLQQMYQVLKQGKNIIIFPEGTRSKDGMMKEFKESFAILSMELYVPVVPVAIIGAELATYSKIKIPRFFSRVGVEFLPAVYPLKEETSKELAKRVEQQIKESIGQ